MATPSLLLAGFGHGNAPVDAPVDAADLGGPSWPWLRLWVSLRLGVDDVQGLSAPGARQGRAMRPAAGRGAGAALLATDSGSTTTCSVDPNGKCPNPPGP